MTDSKIEDTRVVPTATLHRRNVRNSMPVHIDMRDRPVDLEIVQIPCTMDDGNNAHPRRNVIDLQQGRI